MFILLVYFTTSCETIPPTCLKVAERCADLPHGLTASAHFMVDGEAYIFGGRTENSDFSNCMYKYDCTQDQWNIVETNIPLKPCVRPRAISVGDKVYIGLGAYGKVLIDSTYLQDWWEWTPQSNEWKQLTDYPSNRTVGPVVFSDNRYIYMAYGGMQNFERWIFRYDISQDEWLKLSDGIDRMATYPPRAHSAAGTNCGNRFFLGAGFFRGSHDFWVEMEFVNDSVIWHRKSSLPSKRHNAVAISDGRYIYVAGGSYHGGTVTTGKVYDDILRYDPINDQWEFWAKLPDGGRENMVGWICNDTLYIGLGSDKYNRPCKQLYRIAL